MNYETFLKSKRIMAQLSGVDIDQALVNPTLFPFQRDVAIWALRKGRAAVFLECGLGKTFIQLEWARLLNTRALIVAPLSVARQTTREAAKLGTPIHYTRSGSDLHDGLNITNYEMIEQFNPSDFGAVVLDESSILKALSGSTRRTVTRMFADTPYRLCCTATPAPNDYVELGNHAEFLGICTEAEMRSMFFINANKEHTFFDGDTAYRKKGSNKGGQEWRLKHSAEEPFFHWLASWAISMTDPSDLGYDNAGYSLPPLRVIPSFVAHEHDGPVGDQLFFTKLDGIANRAAVRKSTLAMRMERLVALVNGNADQWIVWCGLDAESDAAAGVLDGAVEVRGSDSPDRKADVFEAFQDGTIRVLVTKGRIGGFGLNFQNAHRMAFFGLNDSWELFYQCCRRMWRFGQARAVDAHVILSDHESEIYQNVMRKDAMAARLRKNLVARVRSYEEDELGLAANHGKEYDSGVVCILPKWLEACRDIRVRLSDVREACSDEAQPGEHEKPAEVLQPAVQRRGEAREETRPDSERDLSLPGVREGRGDVSKPIGAEGLRPEVLRAEVSREGAEGEGQSGVVRGATFPEWLYRGVLARPSIR